MERSKDWMDQARGDLSHAKHVRDAGFYDWACFSAQQSAEKAVKAVLQSLGLEAWGHSVADLLGALKVEHPVPDALLERGSSSMQRPSSSSVRVFYPEFDGDELLARLRDGVARLEPLVPLRRVVLFGSWARGRQTAASDVDLLVVYRGPSRDDVYRLVRKIIGMRGLEPHVYTVDEAASLAPTIERMTVGGIIIR